MKKKKWLAPECVKVKLLPEEAVLTACKAAGAGRGPTKNNCIQPAPACVEIGS